MEIQEFKATNFDHDWLIEDGITSRLIQSMDWSGSSLGPRHLWPPTLCLTVNMILASASPMVLMWGTDQIMIYNDAYIQIAGNRHPMAMGKRMDEVWPEVLPFAESIHKKLIHSGKALLFKDQLFFLNRKTPNEECYFTLSYIPIRMVKSTVSGILLILEETTRYIMSERKLSESRDLIDKIIESSPSHIFFHDCDFKFTLMNQSLADFFKISKQQALGKSLWEIFPKNVADRLAEANQAIIEAGKSMVVEENLESLLGKEEKTLIASKFPVRDSLGNIIGVGGVATDITDRKRLEKELLIAKQKAEELALIKAKFLDTAAHELRTPITVISMILQLIDMKLKKNENLSIDLIKRMRAPVDQLIRLVTDLLDISRLEHGLIFLKKEKHNLIQTIASTLSDFQLISPYRKIHFEVPKESVELPFDQARISQVISNLLDNAIKYTPENKAIIIRVESKNGVARVSVQDHGEGISDLQMKGLFDAFSRLDSENALKAPGLGLGLNLCRGIIELHGGVIGVESKVGEGSTFYFDLPLAMAQASNGSNANSTQTLPPSM